MEWSIWGYALLATTLFFNSSSTLGQLLSQAQLNSL